MCKDTHFSLIFYITDNKINETPLTLESSKMMSKSELAGYLYIGYCSNCENYIKTYIPEVKGSFDEEAIINRLKLLIDNSENNIKILVFDFDDTLVIGNFLDIANECFNGNKTIDELNYNELEQYNEVIINSLIEFFESISGNLITGVLFRCA